MEDGASCIKGFLSSLSHHVTSPPLSPTNKTVHSLSHFHILFPSQLFNSTGFYPLLKEMGFLVTLILLIGIAANLCSSSSSCPPLPIPFSSAIQVECSTPHSLLHINNLTFSLLRFDTNTSTLLISPSPSQTLPSSPINLTGTPFRLPSSFCSRLSLLKPCLPPQNCSLPSPFHCSLLHHPLNLLPSCPSPSSPPLSEHSCQTDPLGFLNSILALGIPLIWDHNTSILPSASPSSSWAHRHHNLALLASLFALLSFLFLLLLALLHHSNTKSNQEDPTAIFLHRHRSPALLPPVFSFSDLQSSTNNFHPSRKIGHGGFGSVYLGHLPNSRFVAVKQLHQHHHRSPIAFCNEILILSSLDHPNLVTLHGYCSDPRGLLLVYDYIPNGTLADHLHGPSSLSRRGALTWRLRLDIALQIALAVEYLHFSANPPIVHRDITTSNIFLEKDLRVKLGDFGLSRLLALPEDNTGFVWTGPQGTPGYLDPDYHRSFRLTEKSDVYSYGVVLMELLTGMKAVDMGRDKREVALADMVVSRIQMGLLHQVVDPVISAVEEERVVRESVGAVAELAFRCVAADKDDRPDSREVVAELRRIWSRDRGMKSSNSNAVVVPES